MDRAAASPLWLTLIAAFFPASAPPVDPMPFPFFSNEPEANMLALGEDSVSESCTPLFAAAA